MALYPTPVIDKANEDEDDDHHDLDQSKPVFGFALPNKVNIDLFLSTSDLP